MSDPRRLASWLLLATGIAHVADFVAQGMSEAAVPVGAFGVAYLGIGAWLRVSTGKAAPMAGIAVPLVGGLGGAASLFVAVEPLMLAYFVVDAIVVGLCVRLLVKPAAAPDGGLQ